MQASLWLKPLFLHTYVICYSAGKLGTYTASPPKPAHSPAPFNRRAEASGAASISLRADA